MIIIIMIYLNDHEIWTVVQSNESNLYNNSQTLYTAKTFIQ